MPNVALPPWCSVVKQWIKNKVVFRGGQKGLWAVRDRIADLRLVSGRESPVIVDGGANKGDVTALLLHQFHRPIIHAFEPIPGLATRLRSRFSSNPGVIVHQAALGAENRRNRLTVTGNTVSSSVLDPSQLNREVHGDAVGVREQIDIEEVRLDDVVQEQVDIIKLDLQGYELEALRGASRHLAAARAVLVEVEFVPMYDGQARFSEIHAYLDRLGYDLFNFYDLWTLRDGRAEAADVIYVKRASTS